MGEIREPDPSAVSITVQRVLQALQEIAPLEYAEDWDNVGLLLEPVPRDRQNVSSILLTIDLTEPVIAEACELSSQLVVAYHPPIFHPLSRLTQADPRHRLLLRAIGARIAVYSPHTALDAAPDGVNDWLADGLPAGRRASIGSSSSSPSGTDVPESSPVGQGRMLELDEPVVLDEIINRVKQHLGLDSLRVAAARGHAEGVKIQRIALCAGSGTQVVSGTDAQVYLTGEMGHHDVLAALEAGRSVILCEHTNTERGYLPKLRDRLRSLLGESVRVEVSARDSEPMQPR